MNELDKSKIGEGWSEKLKDEFSKQYFLDLERWVMEQYSTKNILPGKEDVFKALEYTDFNDVKCVLIGQDPYATDGFAHGISFSVNKSIRIPRSLRNIYKELNSDIGCYVPNNGYLKKWAVQGGVLLLNNVLTVEEGKSNSHINHGWEIFTDEIVRLLNEREQPVVFILFGKDAKTKKMLITNPKHFIIEATHPSPPSANRGGFFGVKPFSKANEFLTSNGIAPIDWQIEDI